MAVALRARGLFFVQFAAGVAIAFGKAAAKPAEKPAEKDTGGWQEKTKEDGKVVQELKIEAPTMTEEDQYGYVMPDRYRCDSCRAVMYHLNEALKKVHPKSRRMKQWEYTDAFDDACRDSFEGYGIKLVNGENALSGPGLKQVEDIAPGQGAIQMSSDTWKKRLGEICRKVVYERIGEEELYEKFREEGSISDDVCTTELRDCVLGPKLPPKTSVDEVREKPDKKKVDRSKTEKKKPKKAADPVPVPTPAPVRVGALAAVEGRTDVQTFLRSLAVRHGLTSDEYVGNRTEREWEKLIMAMAGRIFNHAVDLASTSGSCPNEATTR